MPPSPIKPRAAAPFDVVGYGVSSVDYLCVIDHHPRLDSKQQLVAFDVQPGGQVPTALVALQRWGMQTAYVGAFGDDDAGRMARSAMEHEGIDLSAAPTLKGVRQLPSVILIDHISGERSVLGQAPGDLVVREISGLQTRLTDGRVLLMDAVDIPAATQAAEWARRAGILTVLDIDNPGPGIGELLARTDVLIVGSEFPERLTGERDARAALRKAAALGPWFVGVTLGPGGVLALVNGEFHFVKAFPTKVIDSTGAGDLFHAGSVYGLLQGWSTQETLRFAAAAAALKCEKLGARPGIPTVERALELAASYRA